MVETLTRIKDRYGMHARPALVIKKMADAYPSTKIIIIDPETKKAYDAKSILELMTMGKAHDDVLVVKASGDKEKEASERIAKLIQEFDVDN